MSNMRFRAAIYFARPDALQGSLAITLNKVRPTLFGGVPRVWEKFEEKMKEVASKRGALAQKLAGWAKRVGFSATQNQLKGKTMPLGFNLANMLVFKKGKKAIGIDQSRVYIYGAAPLKKQTREFFASLNIPLQNCYGMSETGGLVTGSINKPHWNDLNAAGVPLPGIYFKIEKK